MAWAGFDTHQAVKALCGAGFNDAQAEAVVEQINSAYSDNVATKADVDRLVEKEEFRETVAKLATREELREAVEKLATREELREAVEKLATKEELREAVAKLATKEELRETVAKLATKEELREAVAKLVTRDDLEELELRMSLRLEKQTTLYLGYLVATAAGIVVLSKALDLLVG